MNKNVVIVLVVAIVVLGLGYFINESRKEKEAVRATYTRYNTEKAKLDEIIRLEKEKKFCNVKTAEHNFERWLEFTYPDWKIKDGIVVIENGNCNYRLRFTGINPHYAKLGVVEEEVIVVSVSYINNFDDVQIETIRGTLY
jgi:hypothetical protein|tara:strand:+ start:1343 stop:1765 length:423 start_codon:yes stop_codon:yes gene_type:complete